MTFRTIRYARMCTFICLGTKRFFVVNLSVDDHRFSRLALLVAAFMDVSLGICDAGGQLHDERRQRQD